MTAQLLQFPDIFRPASPRDEPGSIVAFPPVTREPVECPKIAELRRQAKEWLARDKSKFSGGTCNGGEG